MKEEKLKELFVLSNGFTKEKGFAINTQEMNPEEYEEIFFAGKSLVKAIEDFFRPVTFYAYRPSDGVQIFEDLDDAVDYVDKNDVSFDDFKKAHQRAEVRKR
jgi:hypothetical protein